MLRPLHEVALTLNESDSEVMDTVDEPEHHPELTTLAWSMTGEWELRENSYVLARWSVMHSSPSKFNIPSSWNTVAGNEPVESAKKPIGVYKEPPHRSRERQGAFGGGLAVAEDTTPSA
jgi:hypothetical protein